MNPTVATVLWILGGLLLLWLLLWLLLIAALLLARPREGAR